MILISLFIQIHSTDNEMSIKKFVYLMINNIERQNNIKKLIKSMRIYDHVIAREIYRSVSSISSNQLTESMIKNFHWLLENHKKILLKQQHSSLKIKHFNKWSHYILLSIVLRSIINSSL